jgi:hypothetical protein
VSTWNSTLLIAQPVKVVVAVSPAQQVLLAQRARKVTMARKETRAIKVIPAQLV